MSNRTSATRYARALFDVAIQESADLSKIQQDLTEIVAAIGENPELSRVLASRGVSDAARRQIIVAVGEKIGVATPVSKLLGMLADRRRLELVPDLAAVYTERLLEHQNVVQADVTTAAPIGRRDHRGDRGEPEQRHRQAGHDAGVRRPVAPRRRRGTSGQYRLRRQRPDAIEEDARPAGRPGLRVDL